MNDLKIILQRIETIRPDLYAEIILEPAITHTEKSHPFKGVVDWAYREEDFEEVVDKPAVTMPDTEKRRAAATKLQEIYSSSGWYTARYAAGQALRVENETLNSNVDSWMENDNLEKRLNAVSVFEEKKTTLNRKQISLVDTTTRKETLNDLICLYQLSDSQKAREVIERVYNRQIGTAKEEEITEFGSLQKQTFNDEMVITAGKALGYSSASIWYHKDPIFALISIAATIFITGSIAGTIAYTFLQTTGQ